MFTGFRDKDLETKITNMVVNVSNSVSSKTTAVIRADNSEEKTSKIVEAEEKGIPILTKTQFINQYKLNNKLNQNLEIVI